MNHIDSMITEVEKSFQQVSAKKAAKTSSIIRLNHTHYTNSYEILSNLKDNDDSTPVKANKPVRIPSIILKGRGRIPC